MNTKHPANGPAYKKLRNELPNPNVPCTIGISCVKGECPLGFVGEDVWRVDEQGNTNFPLCQEAIDVLGKVIERINAGRDFDSRAQCNCQYAECQVTFVVHAPDIVQNAADKALE